MWSIQLLFDLLIAAKRKEHILSDSVRSLMWVGSVADWFDCMLVKSIYDPIKISALIKFSVGDGFQLILTDGPEMKLRLTKDIMMK